MKKVTLLLLIIILYWFFMCLLPAMTAARNMENAVYRISAVCESGSAGEKMAAFTLENVPESQRVFEKMNGHTIIGIKTTDREEAKEFYALYKAIPQGSVLWEEWGDLNGGEEVSRLLDVYACQRLETLQVCTLPFCQTALREGTQSKKAAVGYPYLLGWY